MTTRLTWRDGEFGDRGALQRFRCTPHRLQMEVSVLGVSPKHPAMWEWQVQEYINEELKVPPRKGWIVRLGWTDDGLLGAVQVTQVIDAGAHYNLVYGAVEVKLQRRGLFIGDEMLQDTFSEIADRCADLGATDEILLTTQVHQSNESSQKMCHRNGFRNTGSAESDDYDDWERVLPPTDSEDGA